MPKKYIKTNIVAAVLGVKKVTVAPSGATVVTIHGAWTQPNLYEIFDVFPTYNLELGHSGMLKSILKNSPEMVQLVKMVARGSHFRDLPLNFKKYLYLSYHATHVSLGLTLAFTKKMDIGVSTGFGPPRPI